MEPLEGPSRDVLEKYGVETDSAVNGVWLRSDYLWTLNNSKRYFDTINHALRRANSREDALQILKQLKNLLSMERFPLKRLPEVRIGLDHGSHSLPKGNFSSLLPSIP
jgi:hypothetical protein